MIEGWNGDEYIVLFSEEESSLMASACGLTAMLPGFSLSGLRAWQDFIVRDQAGATFIVPSVPLDRQYVEAFKLPEPSDLPPDARLAGKVKWLVKPLIFGGSPVAESNVSWISHHQHAELVRWWNEQYRAVKAAQG